MEITKNRIGYLFVLAIGVGAFSMATGFPPESAAFPLIVSGAMILFALILLTASFVARRELAGAVAEAAPRGWFIHAGRFPTILLLTLAYFIGVGWLGYHTATALMIPIGGFALGLRRPLLIVVTTVAYLALVYIAFGIFFNRPLPTELILRLTG